MTHCNSERDQHNTKDKEVGKTGLQAGKDIQGPPRKSRAGTTYTDMEA